MSLRRLVLPLIALCLGGSALGGLGVDGVSGATYTATSSHGAAVGAANDWTPPTVALGAVAGTVSGTVGLTATAADDRGTVASVVVQRAAVGTTTWTTICTRTAAPYTCSWDTTGLPDGGQALRAVATDDSGYTATSATVLTTVDNATASVRITSPVSGTTLGATTTVTAEAASNRTVDSVALQYRLAGAASWTGLCLDTVAPYSCTWDSGLVAAGSYELRAVMTYAGTRTLTSATVTATVSGTVRGSDVQVTDVLTPGMPAMGDVITLTYSGVVAPGSLKTGWDGTGSTPLSIDFHGQNVLGNPITASRDWAAFVGANLGHLSFEQNYVQPQATVRFAASMTRSTQTVGGVPVTVVTVTLGLPTSGAMNLKSGTSAASISWAPSASATSTTGSPVVTTTVVEKGVLDRDF